MLEVRLGHIPYLTCPYKAYKLVLREFPGSLLLSCKTGLGVFCYDPNYTMINTNHILMGSPHKEDMLHYIGNEQKGTFRLIFKKW